MREGIKMGFEACAMIEDEILVCFAYNFNLIFTINLESGKTEILGSIPGEPFFKKGLIADIQFWNGKLFFIPYSPSKLWVYTLKSQSWESISFGKEIDEAMKYKFSGSFIIGNILYIVGYFYFGIVKMDLNEYYHLKYIPGKKWDRDNYIWGRNIVQKNNKVYLTSCTNKIIVFDLIEESYEYKEIGMSDECFWGICNNDIDMQDECFVGICNKDASDLGIVPVSITTTSLVYRKERRSYKIPKKQLSYYEGMCICGKELFINGLVKNSIKIDLAKFPYIPEIIPEKIYFNKFVTDELAIRSGKGYIDIYSTKTKKWRRLKCQIEDKQYQKVVNRYSGNSIIMEEDLSDLKLFLSSI